MRQFTKRKKKKNGQKQVFRTLEINQRLAAILENLIHTHPPTHTPMAKSSKNTKLCSILTCPTPLFPQLCGEIPMMKLTN